MIKHIKYILLQLFFIIMLLLTPFGAINARTFGDALLLGGVIASKLDVSTDLTVGGNVDVEGGLDVAGNVAISGDLNMGGYNITGVNIMSTGTAVVTTLNAGAITVSQGPLTLPASSSPTPMLNFTGNTTTGISATGNTLTFEAAGNAIMVMNSTGVTMGGNLDMNVGVIDNADTVNTTYLSGTRMTGDLDMDGYNITNVSAVTTDYLSGTIMTGDLDMIGSEEIGYNITGAGTIGADTIDADTVNATFLSAVTMNGNIAMGGNKITGVGAGTAGAPAIAWANDTGGDSGIYSSGPSNTSIAANGGQFLSVGPNYVTAVGSGTTLTAQGPLTVDGATNLGGSFSFPNYGEWATGSAPIEIGNSSIIFLDYDTSMTYGLSTPIPNTNGRIVTIVNVSAVYHYIVSTAGTTPVWPNGTDNRNSAITFYYKLNYGWCPISGFYKVP